MSASVAALDEDVRVRAGARAAGRSDPGRIRQGNEDRFHIDTSRGIYIVIDGVGGRAGGEIAAETALLQVRTRLERKAGSAEERLREAITLANNEIHRLSRTNSEWAGMACVLTVALVEGDHVTVGHVGDSRLYKLRPGGIEKLTHDHSPVGEREDAGELTEHDAMRHPRRNEVFRDVGSERHTPSDEDFVEIVRTRLEPDAGLLLCSDGLSDLVTAHEILATVEAHRGDPDAIVGALVAGANRAGGKDNVTAVFVEAAGPGRPYAPAGRTRSVATDAATHAAALVLGVVLGACAMFLLYDRLTPLLPGVPLAAVTEEPRPPRTLVVRQTAAAEFATIGDALAAARPGDTILVGAGEYREQLMLGSGIALASEIPHRAVIRPGSNTPAPAVTADGIEGAALRGFQIIGEGEQFPVGVFVRNSELEVQDTRISGTALAVDVSGVAAVTLRANVLVDNTGPGVRVRAGAHSSLLHNMILRNGRGRPAAPGVLVDAGVSPVFLGNVIADNGAEGIAGITAAAGALILRNNVFVADARPNARGPFRVAGGPARERQ